LSELESTIRSINRSYSNDDGPLSPAKVKGMKKKKILDLLDSQDLEVQNAINKSNYGILYKICTLSSEYINPTIYYIFPVR
jgi:hypothetical protein